MHKGSAALFLVIAAVCFRCHALPSSPKLTIAPPLINDRFCALVAFNDSEPSKPDIVRFKHCVDLKASKSLEDVRGRTSIFEGGYTTALLPDGNCTAYAGDIDSAMGQAHEWLRVDPKATLANWRNHTWETVIYSYWNGYDHTCTCKGNRCNEGERQTTWWTLSDTATNGTYDLVEKGVFLQDCEGGDWKSAGGPPKIYTFTEDYTRDVDPSIFERPASYCYDPKPWVHSLHCHTTVPATPYSPSRTVEGCGPGAGGDMYQGCCAVSEATKLKAMCGEPTNCSSIIYGKAFPSPAHAMVAVEAAAAL